MPIYNKLVRDRIPEVLEQNNLTYTTRILEKDEYITEVKKKLAEELEEYQSAGSDAEAAEELADLLELIHAAAALHGSSMEEIEKIREEKAEKRGAFNEGIFLIEVKDE